MNIYTWFTTFSYIQENDPIARFCPKQSHSDFLAPTVLFAFQKLGNDGTMEKTSAYSVEKRATCALLNC